MNYFSKQYNQNEHFEHHDAADQHSGNHDDQTVYVNYEKETYQNPGSLQQVQMTQQPYQENPIDELYYKLGKAYYEGAFEDPLPQLLPLFDKITALKNAKLTQKPDTQTVPDLQTVPDMQTIPDMQVMPDMRTMSDITAPQSKKEDVVRNRFCTNCGAKLEENARFCIRCGMRVDNMM